MELTCKMQNYEWGKKGTQSKVATLYKNVNNNFKLEENLPYAELWMGTHVNGPSVVRETGKTLSSFISENPKCLGDEVIAAFNEELPFLFKVLSINKALSIQAHPSKAHAEELHGLFPDIYKDPNHKPEIAIALTPFEALCGFRLVPEIKKFILDIPELNCIVDLHEQDDTEFLKKSFKSVLTCDKNIITSCIDNLLLKFKTMGEENRRNYLADLVEKLHREFPYDNGILMVYFLNYLKLQPSEAIYLAANEPHAYLSGDCIECMACSDNVVRAGLTPKFIDVATLCSMLNYKGESVNTKIFAPIEEDCFSKIYKPPINDFAVVQIKVPCSENSYVTKKRKSASIVLVISGTGDYENGNVMPGTTLFLPANETVAFTNLSQGLVAYQALANV